MPLTWSVSMRSRTSPSMAKPDRWTLRAAAVGGVLAVEADAGVHRAVRRRRGQRDLVTLDDRVPVAGALDRHVVDDDVPVDLVRARRDVDLAGACAWRTRSPCRTRRPSRAGRSGRRRRAARSPRCRSTCGGPTSSRVEQVDDRPRGVAAGRHGEPDLVAGLVGPAEQQALLVVEVVRPERRRDDRRRRGGRGHAAALGDPPVRVEQAGVRVVGERVLVVEPGVLRGQRHRPARGRR